MSERRACSLIGADRSSVRYQHRRPDDTGLREALHEAAGKHRRFGYRRLHVILRRDGHVLNRKRTQRIYREEGLMVRRRRRRKRALGTRAPLVTEAVANARWSVDFMQDQFVDGRRFRILNVLDDVTKRCLASVADTSISGARGECQVFCVWLIGSMLPERSKDDDDFQRTAGRVAEGL